MPNNIHRRAQMYIDAEANGRYVNKLGRALVIDIVCQSVVVWPSVVLENILAEKVRGHSPNVYLAHVGFNVETT